MRVLLQKLEAGESVAVLADLGLAEGELAALRAAGVVRDAGAADVVELSLSDLVRALRVLYAAPGRGLVAWSELQPTPMAVGVQGEDAGGRWVYLVSGSRHGVETVGRHQRPTLALVLTADHVTRKHREAHAPGARVELEVLEEVLTVKKGKLARRERSGSLRFAREDSEGARDDGCEERERETEGGGSAKPATAPVRFPGATRWNQVRIRAESYHMLRVDHGPHISRATAVDMGMAHGVTRKPTILWDALHTFCEGHGTFRSRRFGNEQATRQTISRLGRELRRLFGIASSPFHPYSAGLGWSTQFVAEDRVDPEEREER